MVVRWWFDGGSGDSGGSSLSGTPATANAKPSPYSPRPNPVQPCNGSHFDAKRVLSP